MYAFIEDGHYQDFQQGAKVFRFLVTPQTLPALLLQKNFVIRNLCIPSFPHKFALIFSFQIIRDQIQAPKLFQILHICPALFEN